MNMVIGFIVALIVIAGGAYWVGEQNGSSGAMTHDDTMMEASSTNDMMASSSEGDMMSTSSDTMSSSSDDMTGSSSEGEMMH